MHTTSEQIDVLLARSKTIAIVGLSDRPQRPSHGVAAYLQAHGYRIIPVNPNHAGMQILGEYCYPDLREAAQQNRIDIVDCFRKAADIPPVVEAAIAIGAPCIWMQLGIAYPGAPRQAGLAGLQVVMDKCIEIEHAMRF